MSITLLLTSNFFGNFQAAGAVVGILSTAMMLKWLGFHPPQLQGFTSNTLLGGTIKFFTYTVGRAFLRNTTSIGDSLVTRPQQLRLNVTPPNLPFLTWNPARLSYMLDVLLERHPFSWVLLRTHSCSNYFILMDMYGVLSCAYLSECFWCSSCLYISVPLRCSLQSSMWVAFSWCVSSRLRWLDSWLPHIRVLLFKFKIENPCKRSLCSDNSLVFADMFCCW